jgi:hypothetical protein
VGRNLIYLIAKDVPGVVIRRNALRIVEAQVRIVLNALKAIRGAAARARLRGVVVGLVTWPKVLSARRRVMSTARVSPREFERTLKRFARGRD